MSEFRIVAHPDRPPTSCAFCGETKGPFLSTETEIFPHGWVWICLPYEDGTRPGCLGGMARMAGFALPTERAELLATIAMREQENAEIRELLALEVESKLISLSDARELLAEQGKVIAEELQTRAKTTTSASRRRGKEE